MKETWKRPEGDLKETQWRRKDKGYLGVIVNRQSRRLGGDLKETWRRLEGDPVEKDGQGDLEGVVKQEVKDLSWSGGQIQKLRADR